MQVEMFAPARSTQGVRRVRKCQPEKLVKDKFATDAMGYLVAWVKERGPGRPFSAEEITLAALKDGVAAPDMRHWGDVFRRAAAEGYIRRSTALFRRSMGNNTLAAGWEGV